MNHANLLELSPFVTTLWRVALRPVAPGTESSEHAREFGRAQPERTQCGLTAVRTEASTVTITSSCLGLVYGMVCVWEGVGGGRVGQRTSGLRGPGETDHK